MKRCITSVVTMFVAFWCLVAQAQASPQLKPSPTHTSSPVNTNSATQTVWVYIYLREVADRLGCYFTFETLQNLQAPPNFKAEYVIDDPHIATVEALVKKLQKELTTFTVVQDKTNPKIIHFIATALMVRKGYPLDRKMSVTYSGKLSELPDVLGHQLQAPLITQRSFVAAVIFTDPFSKVAFTATNRTMRSILTDCAPLAHYDRFIWTAETLALNGKVQTEVNYQGPVVVPDKPTDQIKP